MATGLQQETSGEPQVRPPNERRHWDGLFWGGTLIWAGIVFGFDSMGYLPQIGNAQTWGYIFAGAGLYGLLLNAIRQFSSGFAKPSLWDYAGALILLVIGLGGLTGFVLAWPFVLVILGVVLLGSAFLGRSD